MHEIATQQRQYQDQLEVDAGVCEFLLDVNTPERLDDKMKWHDIVYHLLRRLRDILVSAQVLHWSSNDASIFTDAAHMVSSLAHRKQRLDSKNAIN